nr:hypothetical protein [uncultured Pseudomonas sp.]
MSNSKLKVEIHGIDRSGISQKSGKPYVTHVAFAHLPGVPYPQEVAVYGGEKGLANGHYEVPYRIKVTDDGRTISLLLDVANATPVAGQPRTNAA